MHGTTNVLYKFLCLSFGVGSSIINWMKQAILKKVDAPEPVKKSPNFMKLDITLEPSQVTTLRHINQYKSSSSIRVSSILTFWRHYQYCCEFSIGEGQL
jgi:hypothetical protein